MSDKPVEDEAMIRLRHDINNQLSNINLALETLRYEIPEPTEDSTFCINAINTSVEKIKELLKPGE
jgi:hypothetical protein